MEIRTKYNLNQQLYYIEGWKIRKGRICNINISLKLYEEITENGCKPKKK